MKLITELYESLDSELVTEAKSGKKTLFIEGIFLQGNLINGNKRKYPTEVLAKEVKRYNKEFVEKNRAYGELGHPSGPTINPDRISHRIVSLKQEGDNFMGRASIIKEGNGKIVYGIIEDGGQLAVSSRAMASLKREGNVNVVQDDLFISTAADIVIDPSAPNAFVNGVLEGREWVMEGMILVEQDVNEYRKEINKAARSVVTKTEDEMVSIFTHFINKL